MASASRFARRLLSIRNETVSVVIRGLDFLNVDEDVEDRSDCSFVRTPKIAKSPAHKPEIECCVSTPSSASTDILVSPTIMVQEVRNSRRDWPRFGRARSPELSCSSIVLAFGDRQSFSMVAYGASELDTTPKSSLIVMSPLDTGVRSVESCDGEEPSELGTNGRGSLTIGTGYVVSDNGNNIAANNMREKPMSFNSVLAPRQKDPFFLR